MFKNNIKTFLRELRRNKLFNFINIFGLAIGFACAAVLCAIILYFLSFDKFHKNGDYIYQCFYRHTEAGNTTYVSSVSYMLGKSLKEEVPEIKNSATVSFPGNLLIISGNKKFTESGIYADPSIYSIFTFPLITHLSDAYLTDINSISISESLAKKYFGSSDAALGKLLIVIDSKIHMNLVVRAVFKDVPENSSLKFNFLIPMAQHIKNSPFWESWNNVSFNNYVQVHENANIAELNKKLSGFIQRHSSRDAEELFLFKFNESLIHYPGSHDSGVIIIYIIILIGAGILIIASVNFVNLSTSRSVRKAKEVGIRKVVGANRNSLIFKFLNESLLTAIIAAAISLCLAEGILILVNKIFAGYIKFQLPFNNPVYLLILLAITLLVGLVAGILPAYYLASFSPITTLKGEIVVENRKYLLRKTLLVFQFVISTILLFTSLVLYEQINFIKTTDLGLNINNILKFEITDGIKNKFEYFKNELNSLTCIKTVTFSSENPIQMTNATSAVKWKGKPDGMVVLIHLTSVDDNYLKTFNIKLISGLGLDDNRAAGKDNFLVNQKMAELMGKVNPVGEELLCGDRKGYIIGVVKDFNNEMLNQSTQPIILYKDNNTASFCFLKPQNGELFKTINTVKTIYEKYEKENPFSYAFLDEEFAKSHVFVDIVGNLFNIFSGIAIFISCLGLFGLTALIIDQRKKEISIRKVLGATAVSIISLASKNFILLIIISNIIAVPIGYLFCSMLLNTFAYKVNLTIWFGFIVFSIELLAAFVTINFHTIKIALSNPVNSLRSE